MACIEADFYVDEEPYELVSFSSAVKTSRLEREAFLGKFVIIYNINKKRTFTVRD